MIIQIHIDIVAVRLKGFHLAFTQDMLQGIPSLGTVLVTIDNMGLQKVQESPPVPSTSLRKKAVSFYPAHSYSASLLDIQNCSIETTEGMPSNL